MTPKQQKVIVDRLASQLFAKMSEELRIQTTQQVYAATLITLHDKFGFTPDMIVKVFEDIVKQFECIADKYVKIEDFYELLGEMGIKVT